MTPKERFFATLAGKQRDRAPVTPLMMRWAADFIGRSFRDYCLDGVVLAEAQLAVARTLHTDMICIISDPWTESAGYGMEFDCPEDATGIPRDHLIHGPEDALALPSLDLESDRPQQVFRAIEHARRNGGDRWPIVGWIEGPIAQYSDMRGLQEAMMDLFDHPDAFMRGAEHLTREALRFATAQVECGADVIGVGDAAASIIGPTCYRELVLPWEIQLIDGIHELGVPVKLHICGNIEPILEDVISTGADIIDLDWMVSVAHAREAGGEGQTFAGNFDPSSVLLQGTEEEVGEKARQCLSDGGHCFMLQPGCEVPHGTPMVNMRAFCPRD